MGKKKITSSSKPNPTPDSPKNEIEKFDYSWKNNKFIASIVIVCVIIIGAGTLIERLIGLANFGSNVAAYFKSEPTISNVKKDSTNLYIFLIFSDKSSFDEWHKEVVFRLGLPKYSRNLGTNEIDDNYIVRQYSNWRKHPNPRDNRILCGFGKRLPIDLINEAAGIKYKFIKATYSEIEEMGFIRDQPNLIGQEVFPYNIPDMPEMTIYIPPFLNRPMEITPEYNMEFQVILFQRHEYRNKYIFDLGSVENRNRISIYLDKEDYLCYRVIDSTRKAHIIKLSHKLFNKKYQLNFKFAKSPDKSYMEIYVNGIAVATQQFNYRIPFYFYNSNITYVGANLDRTYCSKLRIFVMDIYTMIGDRKVGLLSYDGHNLDSIYLSDGEIIAYKDQTGITHFKRR